MLLVLKFTVINYDLLKYKNIFFDDITLCKLSYIYYTYYMYCITQIDEINYIIKCKNICTQYLLQKKKNCFKYSKLNTKSV